MMPAKRRRRTGRWTRRRWPLRRLDLARRSPSRVGPLHVARHAPETEGTVVASVEVTAFRSREERLEWAEQESLIRERPS